MNTRTKSQQAAAEATRRRSKPASAFICLVTSAATTAFIASAMLAGCSQKGGEAPAAAEPEKKSEETSRVKQGTNGEVIITLDEPTQKGMGLEVAPLAAAQLSPELKGYGHVLDVSALASQVADLTTAQAAEAASQAEVKRLKTLAAQDNASERALQAAEAAAAHDQAQLAAARLKLIGTWSSAIAQRQDLPELVQKLSSLSAALVELDLPAGEVVPATPTGARLLTLSDETKPIEAELLGPAASVDPQMQGRGFLLLASPNPARLAPGAAVTGFLSLPGEPQAGVSVPRPAIIRYKGTAWVYRQTGAETFERVQAVLGRPLEDGVFVSEGLKPGDKVVTVGAQQMLSEELKGTGTAEVN